MIAVRNNVELDKMRISGAIVGETLRMIEDYVKPRITTLEIDTIIDEFIRSKNAVPSFKNYNGFPKSSCISIDEVVVHGIPSLRILKEGEIVSIDVGAVINGYHGDAARTFAVGKISAEKQKLIDVTKQSFFEGIKNIKANRRIGDCSNAIQQYVEANGFSIVRVMVGHGIGRKMHEDPNIPNFGPANSGVVLKAGNCLAIEPMVNMGKYNVTIASDGWTCKTVDLLPSAHYENTIIVTNDGTEILTL